MPKGKNHPDIAAMDKASRYLQSSFDGNGVKVSDMDKVKSSMVVVAKGAPASIAKILSDCNGKIVSDSKKRLRVIDEIV
ncbi:MAG: hypothetical protein KGH98_03335 [Candidatus Micrarchaeota archaeon]|nr:hypothetical protein [Candidatus Micrarchaeota archaeon]